MNKLFTILLGCVLGTAVSAQYTKADSLRGGNLSGRDWWDLRHYELSVSFNIQNRSISGVNRLKALVNKRNSKVIFQIDLQDPMVLDSAVVSVGRKKLGSLSGTQATKVGGAYLLPLASKWIPEKGKPFEVALYFHGSPKEAKNPPWDGGIIWKKDSQEMPWVSLACQLTGSSVWFPCKDTQADEPEEGVDMHYTCPSSLVCISNGLLVKKVNHKNNLTTYSWRVKNPINNYCMIPYIGNYVHFDESYRGEKGSLTLDYWVLQEHLGEAQKAFKDVPKTIEAFEYWFGPYPFYEDEYKMVESPHLGMEHQSAIAYGNGFAFGYKGTDLSRTGEGLKWDYIIIHESGHEWFGNSITSRDIADMWIHESFTMYSEVLFIQYWFGKEAANRYCEGIQRNIINDKPIIGDYLVNKEGSRDMYPKGANMLHLVHLMSGDDAFRSMLRAMNKKFYHSIVSSQDIEIFMSEFLNLNLKPIFDQYLRQRNPPKLQLKKEGTTLSYRWVNCIQNFEMPFFTELGSTACTTRWQSQKFSESIPNLRKDTYFDVEVLKP